MLYLLHYDQPLSHAQHYLGSCEDLARIEEHAVGTSGARLPQAFHQHGVKFVVARTWEGGRVEERKLKNHKNARLLCPICREQKLHLKAEQLRYRRAIRKASARPGTPLSAFCLQLRLPFMRAARSSWSRAAAS